MNLSDYPPHLAVQDHSLVTLPWLCQQLHITKGFPSDGHIWFCYVGLYTVGISPLPSDKLVQNWLGVGGVKSLHVSTVRVGHTSHDLIYLVHGGGAGEEGLSCEERWRER